MTCARHAQGLVLFAFQTYEKMVKSAFSFARGPDGGALLADEKLNIELRVRAAARAPSDPQGQF